MSASNIRKLKKAIKNIPNLLNGYNFYANKEKFHLIDKAFYNLSPGEKSFADLGGVWKVNAAYTFYALKNHLISEAYLVDTNFNDTVNEQANKFEKLKCLKGDFTDIKIIKKLGIVDAVFFFDVLLHQVKPDWNEVLTRYSSITDCMIIYNQQFIDSKKTIRLAEYSLEEYKNITPERDDELYEFIYLNKEKINSEYNKKWGDIHNIWQWGITDEDLRSCMSDLGFSEVYFKNYGRFSDLEKFENHGFVFIKNYQHK